MKEMQEMWVQLLSQEDPLEEDMATHSSILAWKIPRTEKPGGLQSMGLKRVRQDWSNLVHMHTLRQCKSAISIHLAPPFWDYLPPSCPSRSSQSMRLSSLCHITTSHSPSTVHMVMYIFQCTFSDHPTLSFPHCVHKSILYICISSPALQTGSSVPFF